MSMDEENGSIELGIMAHAETGERRVSIVLPDSTVILFNAEQADAIINSLNEAVADIKAQPYIAVGTVQ